MIPAPVAAAKNTKNAVEFNAGEGRVRGIKGKGGVSVLGLGSLYPF